MEKCSNASGFTEKYLIQIIAAPDLTSPGDSEHFQDFHARNELNGWHLAMSAGAVFNK
jgi:hypothetical protein